MGKRGRPSKTTGKFDGDPPKSPDLQSQIPDKEEPSSSNTFPPDLEEKKDPQIVNLEDEEPKSKEKKSYAEVVGIQEDLNFSQKYIPIEEIEGQSIVRLTKEDVIEPGGWNLEVVQSLFCPRDMDQISRVPLQLDSEDKWYWAGETHVEYSVKEAYRRLVGETTSTLGFSQWGQIWKIPIAPKIRICLWRTIRNILPVKVALITKGMEIEIECPVCGGAAETIDHIFLQCPLAIEVWNLLGWSCHLVQTESLVEWMEYQFSKHFVKELKLVAGVIWAI
ncbi:unnamed protein product [Cuscuta campestris]|uniref:Reverse transcriptase zinc-binding domain-containing protein n=1 Tax=Cuscuta campestris TaxID=132261 RepID=A0A484M7N8_9ASTE|nr:unnamed protein product [Cuscuta campestris]